MKFCTYKLLIKLVYIYTVSNFTDSNYLISIKKSFVLHNQSKTFKNNYLFFVLLSKMVKCIHSIK